MQSVLHPSNVKGYKSSDGWHLVRVHKAREFVIKAEDGKLVAIQIKKGRNNSTISATATRVFQKNSQGEVIEGNELLSNFE